MPSKKDYSEDARNFFFSQENKKKKKKLEEEHGMLSSNESENAPPEIMNKFLSNVEEFEKAYEHAEKKKIIEILGFPLFKKAEELSPMMLKKEIGKVLSKYAEYNININVIEKDDISEFTFYKFLTEELPEHETDFIQIEGMTTNYIYEEFHPSDKLDAKNIIEWFSYAFFNRDEENIKTYLSGEALTFNGIKKTLTEFIKELMLLISEYGNEIKFEIIFKDFEFNINKDSDGKVIADFIITPDPGPGLDPDQIEFHKQITLNFIFDIEKSEYGGYNIKGCEIK